MKDVFAWPSGFSQNLEKGVSHLGPFAADPWTHGPTETLAPPELPASLPASLCFPVRSCSFFKDTSSVFPVKVKPSL